MSESTNTIVSDFVQEKNLSVLSEKIISKGQFYFQKGKQYPLGIYRTNPVPDHHQQQPVVYP